MTILRTHNTENGQISWDQKIARWRDVLGVVMEVLLAILATLGCGVIGKILWTMVNS